MTIYIAVNPITGAVSQAIEADLAAGYLISPRSDIKPGDVLTDEEAVRIGFVKQTISAAVISPADWRLLLTSEERIKIKAIRTSNAVVEDFYDTIEDTRLTKLDLGSSSVTSVTGELVSVGILTAERKAQIIAGTFV